MQTHSPILVTGATGYVASFLIKLLLEKDFKVKGTVRSLANKSSYQFLYDMAPEKNHNLELIEAELTKKASWETATKGVQYVFHVASPTPTQNAPDDDEYFIKPAVSGTLNVLEAALANGVKKVVVTSSASTISWKNDSKVLTEEDWDDEEGLTPYFKSKLRAEKAVWEFYGKNKGKIEVAVVNPGFVFGPIFNTRDSTSAFLGMIMNVKLPGVFDSAIPMVDVRDVAEVQFRMMFRDGTSGKRYICVAKSVSIGEIAHWMNKEFGKKGVKIEEKKVELEEFMKNEDPGVQMIGFLFGKKLRYDNQRSVKELGMEYLSAEKTIVDTGESLFKFGIVKENKSSEEK